MTGIEVKRKELETAKGILQEGGCLHVDCDECPFGCHLETPWESLDASSARMVNSFISTREAELAELEKSNNKGSFRRADDPSFQFTASSPSLDDFALALIQGGHTMVMLPGLDEGNGEYPKRLYDIAAALKAESDRRRGK